MLIQALERASDDQRKELERWLAADDFVPAEKIAAVTHLYDEIGIKDLCEQKSANTPDWRKKAFCR